MATAVTILAPSLAMPPASYFWPTMKPVMFCKNTRGIFRCAQSSTKCAPLLRALSEQDAVIGEYPDRIAVDVGEAGDQGWAVELLELVQHRTVDNARDHLAYLERRAPVGRYHPVELARIVERLDGLPQRHLRWA